MKCKTRIESILWSLASMLASSALLALAIFAICSVAGVETELGFYHLLASSIVFVCVYMFLTKINNFDIVLELETDERIQQEQKIIIHYMLRYLSLAIACVVIVYLGHLAYAYGIANLMLDLYDK